MGMVSRTYSNKHILGSSPLTSFRYAVGASRNWCGKLPALASSSCLPNPRGSKSVNKSVNKSMKQVSNLRPLKAKEDQAEGSTGAAIKSEGVLSELPSWGMWGLLACYLGWVLGNKAPGIPIYQMSSQEIQGLIHESISLLYINPTLANFNLSLVPDSPEHPVAEALLTILFTWNVMMWPAMVADKKGVGIKNKKQLWYGCLGLFSLVMIPYMALRLSDSNRESVTDAAEPELPSYSPAYGWFGLFVFGTSVAWILFSRPEFGDVAARLNFIVAEFSRERVFHALCISSLLYCAFQFWIMEEAPLKYRLLPYVGLGLWLVEGPKNESSS